jgi:hypothetical protein
MNLKYLLLALILLFIGCKKDDNEGIMGKWNLINVSGSIAGVNIDHPKGEIVWDFGENLIITNNYTGNFDLSFPTGKYDYELKKDMTLYINGNEFGTVTSLTDTSMEVGQPKWSDGVFYKFSR